MSRLFFDEELEVWKIMPESEQVQILLKPKVGIENPRRPETLYTMSCRKRLNHLYRSNPTPDNLAKSFRFKVITISELK